MSNILNNTTSLQEVLEALQNKATGGGGIDTSDATATESDILSGKTAYVDGEKVTGTFSIEEELNTQDDLIAQIQSAVDNLPEASSGEVSLQSKTVTPSSNMQTVTADSGYDGLSEVIVNGDSNLVAENIVSGKTIFGVAGNASGGGNETVTGTITGAGPMGVEGSFYYIDANGNYQRASASGSIQVMKNSILVAFDSGVGCQLTGGTEIFYLSIEGVYGFYINSDFSLMI